MQLFISPEGGIAGDMFAAALIDAGADAEKVTAAMQAAAEKLGRATVRHQKTSDGSSRLFIEVEHHHGHLSSHRATHLLEHLFDDFSVLPAYREFGFRMLNHLIKAEKEAHATFDFDMENHHHQHNHQHTDGEGHHHHHHKHEEPEAWLHEAQDILIDIMGAVMGLQELQAPVNATLTSPVSWGGGSISFSHGTLKVPAPATSVMIKNNGIPAQKGPIDTELFTPTGAAVLSALEAKEVKPFPKGVEAAKLGASRGTKDLPIPPLRISLYS
ncbi:nickel insertion protein [Marinilabilia sp.]|uniref:nickel insertion protein n=1 Tax=Marinilabilia sp. TaxID=2021252 RepID=UPI0025B86398|nr:nickel insertion protein [Marinilabilia sp.]